MDLIGIGGVFAPWLGEWVTVTVAGAISKGVKNQFSSSEIEKALKQATVAAEAAQPETGGLFFRCHLDGRNGIHKFLERFFHSNEVLKELQKPLLDCGKPDVDILVAAFEKLAPNHPEAKNYLPASLQLWMGTFVESYFDQVRGICFQVARKHYLKQLAQRVDDVKFVGIAVAGEEVEKQEILAQIFVMPDVRQERSRMPLSLTIEEQEMRLHKWLAKPDTPSFTATVNRSQDSLMKEQKEWAMRDRSSSRIPAPTILGLPQKKAVVLGAPGSGKTMLVSYFALMLCEAAQSDPTQIGLDRGIDWLPIVVRIRDWILQPNMGLLEYLRFYAKCSLSTKDLPQGFFENWLEQGRALILLDGLDEVVDEVQRRKIAEQIETFLHQYQDNPTVITSRPAGYRWDSFNLDEFPHYTLESFDDAQITTFIDHWYDSRIKDDKAQASRRKADLQSAFARNERIKLLAKNPLLLTIITLIHRYQAILPTHRYKLYEKAVETLLTSWDGGKEIKLYEKVLHFLKPDDLLYILKKLAYWIHTQGSTGEKEGGTLIDKDELMRQLQKDIKTLTKRESHEAKAEAKRFIDFIQKRTGLLNEQGRDRYAFVHKTFQEYLTAEEIFDRADSEDDTEIIFSHFQNHLHDQHWREVLLLLVSKLKGKKAQKAIQAVLDAGSKYEHWLHRDLLFAGWCLTEDPAGLTTVATDLVVGIFDKLVDLEINKSEKIGWKIKHEVGRILYCFGETTLEKDLWNKLQERRDRFNCVRLIEFQAKLGQEPEAINALLLLLQNKDSTIQIRAIEALYSMTVGSEVISYLIPLLGNENVLLSSKASSYLGFLGVFDKELMLVMSPILLSLLRDSNSIVRYNAMRAFGRLRNFDEESVGHLLHLLHDEEQYIRYDAIQILFFQKSSKRIISCLSSLLHDDNSKVKLLAIELLMHFGANELEVIDVLFLLLYDNDSTIHSHAGFALSRLANNNPELVDRLLLLLQGNNVNSLGIVYALSHLNNPNEKVENALLLLLENSSSSVRYFAAEALIRLGHSNSERVKNTLLLLLEHDNLNIRCNAAQELICELGDSSSKVVNVLISCLSAGLHDRLYAAQILGISKIASSEVVNLWLSLLKDQDSSIRTIAVESLTNLAKTSQTIYPSVLKWLDDNSTTNEIGAAIDCLWSIVIE
jgi:HEAT repeat protein